MTWRFMESMPQALDHGRTPIRSPAMHRRQFLRHATLALASAPLLARASMAARTGAAVSGAAAIARTDAAAWHAARRFLSTRFGRIAYVERGSGPAALFIHGFPLNGFQWRGAFDRLAGERRCIAPDMLGLGYTEPAHGQGVAPADQVDMLLALLDALSVQRADVVANDSGGAVAQLLAAHHPQRVRSLLLTNCDTEQDCPPPALRPVIAMARENRFVSQWLGPWLADKPLARSEQGLGGQTFTYRSHPTDEAVDMYLAPLVRDPAKPNAYAIALTDNALAGVTPALRRLQSPVRIVWGTGDSIFSAENPDYLDRSFGHSLGVRRVEEARLFFPEEFPDLIAEEAHRLWASA